MLLEPQFKKMLCTSTFNLSTWMTNATNSFCKSLGGKYISNAPSLSFDIFDIDFADPDAIFFIFPRKRSWLINCHKNILLQLLFVFNQKTKSGILSFSGVSLTYAAIPTNSGVFFLVNSKSPECTAAASTKSSELIIALFSSGLYTP